MYTSVFAYTTANSCDIRLYHGECDISNLARGHTVLPEKLLIRPLHPLVEKGQRFQRYWRLYENHNEMATLVMAPTNLIRHVSSIWCV